MTYQRDPGLPSRSWKRRPSSSTRARARFTCSTTRRRASGSFASSRSLDDLTTALAEEYDATPEAMRDGVEELLAGLRDKGLLVAVAGAA